VESGRDVGDIKLPVRPIPHLEWASQFLDHHAVLVRSKPGTADQLAAAARATSSRLLCTSTLSKITVR
jgi:hypothetical protein